MMRNKRPLPLLTLLLTILLLGMGIFISTGTPALVGAQTEDVLEWSEPFPLSESGSLERVTILQDRNGQFHLFWLDGHSGLLYRRGTGNSWTAKENVLLPLLEEQLAELAQEEEGLEEELVRVTSILPTLALDSAQNLHAFWLDEESQIFHSSVPISSLSEPESWVSPQFVADSATTMQATTDANGNVHLLYAVTAPTANTVPGLYYRASRDGGLSWEDATTLYKSDYFQSLSPSQLHYKMAIGEQGNLFVVWDDPALDAVLLSQSPNNGTGWTSPEVIAERQLEDIVDTPGPANVNVLADGQTLHLLWRNSSGEEGICSQYHQFSTDNGDSWSEPDPFYEGSVTECPTDSELFVGDDGMLFVLLEYRDDYDLLAWADGMWGDVEEQSTLTEFVNPIANRTTELSCLHTAVSNNQLYAFGCGESENGSLRLTDIWLQYRPLGERGDWFEEIVDEIIVWEEPVSIAESAFRMLPPAMVYDEDGRLHVVWGESQQLANESRLQDSLPSFGETIFHTSFEQERWSAARPMLTSPSGKSDQPTIAAKEDKLFVAWSGGDDGQIYFSRSLTSRAASPTEWAAPLELPAYRSAGSGPDMIIGLNGEIIIVHAIPVNEDRGIFLTKSFDDGESWSEPITVFDGDAERWDIVGDPHIAQTNQGLHLIWSEEPLIAGSNEPKYVYAFSSDAGETWSEPVTLLESAVLWMDLIALGTQNLHMVWLEEDGGRAILRHQYSQDGGVSWSNSIRVSDSSENSGSTAVFANIAGELQAIQLVENNEGDLLLRDYLFDGEQWENSETLFLDDDIVQVSALTASISPENNVSIILAALYYEEETERNLGEVYYASRLQEFPQVTATPLPTVTPLPPTPTSTPIIEPTPTATISFVIDPQQETSPDEAGLPTIDPFFISIIPTVLIVIIAFAVGLRVRRAR